MARLPGALRGSAGDAGRSRVRSPGVRRKTKTNRR
jgi:hypothetical protein